MTVKDIVGQIEHLFGRQPEQYMYQLINDGLLDIASTVQHFSAVARTDLTSYQRWYDLDDSAVIDVFRVEILDNNNRYVMIPKLADSHKLLKEDSDVEINTKT
tara:strand:+ start:997 stop:1305 length:309 start_codon:yes stop_codon:yes gene_type:complete